MKKLSAVLVVMAFVGLLAMPQPAAAGVQFGLKVGGNMAKPTGADLDNIGDTFKNKVGLVGGIFLAFNFGKVVTIQTEALYTMKGASFEYTDIDVTVQDTLYGDYIEIPLLLKLKLPTPGIQPFVEAGPYVGFKLHEKLTGEDVPDGETILKNNDYGAVFGGGLQLGRSFSIDVRYSMGLQKILDTGVDAIDFKNGVWSATIGLGF
jgi:Outer membrane protein beta-barrel domain